MRLRAGTIEEIQDRENTWCFLDIGFSATIRSCGLLIDGEEPREALFSEARDELVSLCRTADQPVNIVIEAPLSVSFSADGDPRGRSMEKRGSKTRYWYTGLGCVVLTAAGYVVSALAELENGPEIRLFEGFVSFKDKNLASNHKADILLLRDVVNGTAADGKIISPCDQAMSPEDQVRSAFAVWGLDIGVPPVIVGG